jgi:hypothetical protein
VLASTNSALANPAPRIGPLPVPRFQLSPLEWVTAAVLALLALIYIWPEPSSPATNPPALAGWHTTVDAAADTKTSSPQHKK